MRLLAWPCVALHGMRVKATADTVRLYTVALLWLIHARMVLSIWNPALLGVVPGRFDALPGVLTAPPTLCLGA